MAKQYDVAILGSTVGAYAAACHLRKSDSSCQVAVLSPPPKDTESPLCDWVPRGFFDRDIFGKKMPKQCGATPFTDVVFHNADLTETMVHKYRKPAGHFFEAEKLNKACRDLAKDLGATVRNSSTQPAVELREDAVRLVGSTSVNADFLIIAHDRPRAVISELALPARTVPQSYLMVAGLDVPLAAEPDAELRNSFHVIEMRDRSELGLFFLTDSTLHVRIVSSSRASGNRAAELSNILSAMQEAQILPRELRLDKSTGAVWHPPAGDALEIETHVAKRCLLAGTAGGFAESITGHTGLPTTESAILAAETILAARGTDAVQDTLNNYKTRWRKAMAGYLRPPNTSLHMLLPLLFSNRRMAAKFSGALLFGENI
jgi:flavin-dependent dehydrogenase